MSEERSEEHEEQHFRHAEELGVHRERSFQPPEPEEGGENAVHDPGGDERQEEDGFQFQDFLHDGEESEGEDGEEEHHHLAQEEHGERREVPRELFGECGRGGTGDDHRGERDPSHGVGADVDPRAFERLIEDAGWGVHIQ